MQKLQVQVKRPDGTESIKEITVIRCFKATTGEVYLHANGTYGYKDGAPIASEKDLDIIGAKGSTHRLIAERWWVSRGKSQSAAYYAALKDTEDSRLDDFQEESGATDSELDVVFYSRRRGPGAALSSPKSWQEFGFSKRPDWWGQAVEISFGDAIYTRFKEKAVDENPPLPPASTVSESPANPLENKITLANTILGQNTQAGEF